MFIKILLVYRIKFSSLSLLPKVAFSIPPNGPSLEANLKFFICLADYFTAFLHMSKKHVCFNNYWFLKIVFFLSDLGIRLSFHFNFSSITFLLFLSPILLIQKVIFHLVCIDIQCLLWLCQYDSQLKNYDRLYFPAQLFLCSELIILFFFFFLLYH